MSSLHALAALAVVSSLLGCRTPASDPPKLETPEERFSYAIGARLGTDLRGSGHAIDREQVLRGVEDGLAGSAALSEEEIAAALKDGVERQQARQQEHREQRAQAAAQAGRAFLEQNRARAGVVTLPSGLQYEVLRDASGPVPDTEAFVTCHYRGTLLDGSVFDDTAERGAPRTFQITSVVDGFEEGLLRMPTGARWKLYVPAELGYGEHGAGARIPPNSTLVIEVELLAIGGRPAD